MYKRNATQLIKELARSYPVVAITGPRQSGKTTLSQALFKNKQYVSLETPEQRDFAKTDPEAFLSQSKTGMLIDEAQHVPELFSHIQGLVDTNKKPGQFIVTGSQQLGLVSGINQSLAGRVALVELLPFSTSEIKKDLGALNQTLYKGFYPPLYDRNFKPRLWYEDYTKTYIERDLRQLINIKDLSLFQKFLSLCAARAGQILNYSELSLNTGVDTRTIKAWFSILEASYIIFLLKPHHQNFSKRIVKSPKLYFYDCGLLCYLLRLREEDLALSPYRGAIFESMIVSECLKHNKNYRLGLDFFFWKDNKGVEIDLLFQRNQKIVSVEIKSGTTIQPSFFKNLSAYQRYASHKHGESFLIYGGASSQQRKLCQLMPWHKVQAIFT